VYYINKTSWTKVHISKVSANLFLSTTTWLRQWSSECSVFFNLLNENKNCNVSSEYLNWCSTQIKKAFKTNNKEEQCSTKCSV